MKNIVCFPKFGCFRYLIRIMGGHAQQTCLIVIAIKKCPKYCPTHSLLGAIIFMHFDQLCNLKACLNIWWRRM